MLMNIRTLISCVLLVMLLGSCSTSSTGNNTSLSNKWRIQVSEGAKSTGTMIFRVSPKGQTSIDVRVGVVDGALENKVASVIRDAFRTQLPRDGYHIEKDDGEDVLIKARGDTPRFALSMLTSNVKSVRIRLGKE